MTKKYSYDIESYPNFFSCVVRHHASQERWIFEVSDWCDDAQKFIEFMYALEYHDCILIGFNNFGYDWQVIEHCLAIGPSFTAADAYAKTDLIINGCGYCLECKNNNSFRCETNFQQTVWGGDQKVKQIDLFLIHHFNNTAKSTSLKEIEFNMRSPNVGDLPIKPGTFLKSTDREGMIFYNCHDVDETELFAEHSKPMIAFRETLIPRLGYDVMNWSDIKIGEKYFEKELRDKAPHLLGTGGVKKQTKRPDGIRLADVIIPTIKFETPDLQRVLSHLHATTLTKTNKPPELKDLSTTFDGFKIDIGAGGGHGCVSRQCVRPKVGWKLLDVDVAGYYVSLAIANRFFPAHLSELFCDIYEDVRDQRKATVKKTPDNEMLKLAGNGVYGGSSNEFSIFLDPQYTMQTAINGQLLLYLLVEKLVTRTAAKLIQLNTDGISFLIPEGDEKLARDICKWWEDHTKLELEFAEYEAMWIKDVNNYVAKTKGTPDSPSYCKRIGAYAFETARENPATREVTWWKDHSALVVQKAVFAEMVNGIPIRQFILNHADSFDFMLRSKASGKTKQRLLPAGETDTPAKVEMYAHDDGNSYPVTHTDSIGKIITHMEFEPDAGKWLQKLTRYHIAKVGSPLQIIRRPAPNAHFKKCARIVGVNVGWDVAICDDMKDFDPSNINFDWYIAEAEKLVIR